MNERIKELSRQAWEYAELNSCDGDGRHGSLYRDKFAKLVAQDCIDKIETYRIPVGNSSAGELACEWTYDALKEIRDDIKEHFGVEE